MKLKLYSDDNLEIAEWDVVSHQELFELQNDTGVKLVVFQCK